MPAETNASTERAVVEFFNNELDVPLTLADISIAHRLSRNHDASRRPAGTIVKFTNNRAHNAVYRARKILARNKTGVYIDEHLIQRRAIIFREARGLVKAKKLEGYLDSEWDSVHQTF